MNNMDSVSIIVPVYNVDEFIEECILSVLSQTYENIELILVNDGSTDNSGLICKKYSTHPKIKYLEQNNSGIVAARKKGFDNATGEWIMFVDSDDFLYKNAVCDMMSLTNSSVDIVIAKHDKNTSLDKFDDTISAQDYLMRLYAIAGIPPSLWAKLFRKSLFSDEVFSIPREIYRSEDLLMNLVIATQNAKNVRILKEPVYFYRMRSSSIIHTTQYTYDYCYKLINLADKICETLPRGKKVPHSGKVHLRMHFIKKILGYNGNVIERHHPLVVETKAILNDGRLLHLSDRVLLTFSGKTSWMASRILNKIETKIFRKKI